jgi:phosphate transport system substrate-binding protein
MKLLRVAATVACVALASTARASEMLVLHGSGSTFVHPIMSRWIAAFARRNPNVEVMYQSLGSGRGVQDALAHSVDFGATDDALNDEELASAPGMLHVPIALGGVVVVYNLRGVTALRLSADVVAQIFLGRIARWDDPVIARENPGAHLPAIPIAVAHRADGSGTTAIFTRYLSKVSAEWRSGPGVGRAVQWPVGTGLRGNEGVAGVVSHGEGWIGYVELGYALHTKLATVSLRAADGSYVSPTVATISTAAARAKVPDDFRASLIDVGGGAWPMSGFTWALIPRDQKDVARAKALVEFLWWCTHDGQAMASDLGFAPLPSSLVERIEGELRTVRAGGALVLGVR